jgi:hypothetical protein
MDWLLLAGLGIIWAAFLIPSRGHKARSPETTVEEFERNMDLLAGTESGPEGRWVMTPRKGTRFIGASARERARVRERRRRVLVVLAEATGVTFLIGLVPPLRGMWGVAGVFAFLLGAYVWMLLRLKHMERDRHRTGADPRPALRYRQMAAAGYASGTRLVAEGRSPLPRVSYAGLAAVAESDDLVHVVVRGT